MKPAEITGKQFGRLIAIRRAPSSSGHGGAMWLCKCECGKKKIAALRHLRYGLIRSCGCLRIETQKAAKSHGYFLNGQKSTPTYNSWAGMRARCGNDGNQDYRNYGGRGIKVCDRWDKFENFLSDMGEKPSSAYSLDRIDNEGNYTPKNCRWATSKEQCANRRLKQLRDFEDWQIKEEYNRRFHGQFN